MTIKDTTELLKRIKNHYQNFSINEEKIKEWYKYLKKYSFKEVTAEFEYHLYSSKSNQIPTIADLTAELQSEDDKNRNLMEELIFKCPLCEYEDKMINYSSHMARHNSVNYIKLREKNINEVYNTVELYKMDQTTFDDFYNKFLNRLLNKISDVEEKARIQKILN